MEERRQSNVEHKELDVQRMTSEKASRKICGAIRDRGSSVDKCS